LIKSVPDLSDDPLSGVDVEAALSAQPLENRENPRTSGSVDLGRGDDERPGEAVRKRRETDTKVR